MDLTLTHWLLLCIVTGVGGFILGVFIFRNYDRATGQPSPSVLVQDITRLLKENEKLKRDSRVLSSMLHMMPFPVWRRGEDLAINYCNLAYSETAEESPEKMIASEALELYSGAKTFARVAVEESKAKTERRHLVVNGERRLFSFTEIPMAHMGTLGFALDITELEHTREELQRYISAQSDLLESSAAAMVIYGPDMRLKTFNYAFVSLWKLDEGWLHTHPTYSEVLETMREKRMLPEQANFPAFKQQQLKLFTRLIEPEEEFIYRPDGKALRVIAIPHALGGILFSYEDVTDRLALERSYNTLIAVQKETLNRLHEAVAVFGEDGRLKLSNPTYLRLWQLEPDFVAAEPHFFDILEKTKHFYKYDDWEAFKEQMMAQSHIRTYNYQRMERTNGTVIDWSSVPLPDGATLIIYFDVTDSTLVERSLREKSEALEEADRLKTEFLANVSYELRSPLTSISGFAEMLKQNYFGELAPKQREYVEGILQSSQQLMHLIDDILDLASIEAGYLQLIVSRFDIYAMLSSVAGMVKERAKENKISVKLQCPVRIGVMLADQTRIRQAVFHLLNNALKYTDKGGKIIVGAEAEGENTIRIWVEDTGVGIPAAEQEAVFESFYKGSATVLSGRPGGTGLGLPMVKSYIELHGGTVELESAPGVGTKITCTLMRHNPNLAQYMKAAS